MKVCPPGEFEGNAMRSTLSGKRNASPNHATAPLARTKLGSILRRIRTDIVASGAALLGWDDLDREVAERAGVKKGETRR
jgi:hypothetical protein